MAYGGIKFDNITFTNAGVDTNITVSGLYASTTSGLTVTGAILAGSGSAAAPSFSFGSDPNSGLYSAGADQVAISTGGTGRLFVGSDGKVNVGNSAITVADGAMIGAASSTGARLKLCDSDLGVTATDGLEIFAADGGDAYIWQRENNPLLIGTNGTERLRITSAGLVGIGTSAPSALLDLSINSAIAGLNIANAYNTRSLNITSSANTGPASITDTGYSDTTLAISKATGSATSNSTNAGIYITGTFQHSGSFGAGRGLEILVSNNTNSTGILYGANISATANTAGATAIGLNVNVASTSGTKYAAVFNGGNVLMGTSTARANFSIGGTNYTPQTQFEGGVIQASFVRAASPYVALAHSNTVTSGSSTGNLVFFGNDGTNFIATGSISSEVDGTPGTNDMPGRLVFSTTADGASSPTERMRIDSSGRVGIGTSSPLYTIESASSDDIQISLTRNSVGRWLLGTTSAYNLKFAKEGGAEAMRFDASSRVLVGITSANTSGAKLQTADGLTFPATAVASADPNTLDDYEEGTFTPTIEGNSTAGTATYATQTGRYTKIGRAVFVEIFLNWSSGTGTGNIQIKGLPFNAGTYSGLTVGIISNIALTALNYVILYANEGTNIIALQQTPVGGGSRGGVPYDARGEILISGTYTV